MKNKKKKRKKKKNKKKKKKKEEPRVGHAGGGGWGGGGFTLYWSRGQATLQVVGLTSRWTPKHTACTDRRTTNVTHAAEGCRILPRGSAHLQHT